MTFKEYQSLAERTDVYYDGESIGVLDPSFISKILGLTGEAGEVAEKFKKIVRDKNGEISKEDRKEILKELGDVLWYITLISKYLGYDLEAVGKMNIEKLADRHKRNVIQASGDNR